MKHSVFLRPLMLIAAGLTAALGCSSSKQDGDAADVSHEPPTCEGFVNRELHFCPATEDQRAAAIEDCQQQQTEFDSVGCSNAYGAWLRCGAAATWDCEAGPAGCDDEQTGYFNCLSQFVQRTNCTYTGPQASCPPDKANTFGCLFPTPPDDACIPVPDNTGSANLYCCP